MSEGLEIIIALFLGIFLAAFIATACMTVLTLEQIRDRLPLQMEKSKCP
jgi:hypothetical protein